jgi:hypothetical protein
VIRTSLLRLLAVPAIEVSTTSRFWTAYRQAVALDTCAAADRCAHRQQRLAALLTRARDTSLHRERLALAGLPEEPVPPDDAFNCLAQLTPIAKSKLRRHFPDGATTPVGAADRTYISTSGTTERLTVVADFDKRDAGRAAGYHALQIALGADVGLRCVEIPPNACNVICGVGDGESTPTLAQQLWTAWRAGKLFTRETRADLNGWVERRVLQHRETLAPIPPAPAEPLRAVLDRRLADAARIRPAHLSALPQYLLWLGERLRATGQSWPFLRAVSPYGGLASPRMSDRIAAGFGVPFRNLYGTNELGVIAASCGHGLHVLEDMFVVEVLSDGLPVADGECGELVITDLMNTAMPLIRYRVGDVGRVLAGPCPCGRQTQRIAVLGRVQEQLETPHGLLSAADVVDAFFEDPGVSNLRVDEFAPGRFDVSVVPNADGPPPDLAACQERFATLHGAVRQMTCRTAAYLQPESSGKYKLVFPARRTAELVR